MRLENIIYWSVGSFFAIMLLPSLFGSMGRQWTSELPSQFDATERMSRGSSSNTERGLYCGAIIYRLSLDQTKDIRSKGVAVFASALTGPEGLKYGDWKPTPVPKPLYDQFVFGPPDHEVGLSCSRISDEKYWRAAAEAVGNYYATNGEALILLNTVQLRDHPMAYAQVGYFFTHFKRQETSEPPSKRRN